MRMDRTTELTAKTIVNEWAPERIAKILFEYGEEKFSRRIAGVIAEARTKGPIETTGELVELIKEGILQLREEQADIQLRGVSKRCALPLTMSLAL